MSDDLYAGFDTATKPASPLSLGAGMMQPSLRPPTSLTGVDHNLPQQRPMTSVAGAGYSSSSNSKRPVFDPLSQGAAPALPVKATTPQAQALVMERAVHGALEESAAAAQERDFVKAMERAKEAAKKERILTKFREKNELGDQNSVELTFAVCFQLASMYHASNLLTDALTAYGVIVKNKNHPLAGRLRVNMGNIYYQQKKYPAAIKMYRMAMDQLGQSNKDMRCAIMRNIGHSFIRLGQYADAIHSYEYVMETQPDAQCGFHLVVCYYALGDKEKMKKSFVQLLHTPAHAHCARPDEEDESEEQEMAELTGLLDDEKNPLLPKSADAANKDKKLDPLQRKPQDDLHKYLTAKKKQLSRYVLTAAQLISPVIDKDLAAGYDWVIQALQASRPGSKSDDSSLKPLFPHLAMQVKIAKGVAFLKQRSIPEAIEVFKSFEKQDTEGELLDHAATNLSFLYFLEGDYKSAEKYADMAVRADRYSAKALVNKANTLFVNGHLEQAKELYLEAIGVEADCLEAIYNLGITNRRMNCVEEALQAFKKLHRIVPKETHVIYHIANLYEMMGDLVQATEWFKILHGAVPTDPKILSRLGALYAKQNDENQAFHNYSDSYNCYPANMDVLTWLGVWYVKNELYEPAIQFFTRASEVEPDEMKWQLMVASCYRRMGSYAQALHLYKEIHRKDVANLECLRYICALCKDTNDAEYESYSKLMHKAERAAASDGQDLRIAHSEPDAADNDRAFAAHADELDGLPAANAGVHQRTQSVEPNENFVRPIEPKAKRTLVPKNRDGDEDDWGDGDLPDELLPM